ncbi:SpoIIAA family protein [Arthrobacter sp. MDT3-44]
MTAAEQQALPRYTLSDAGDFLCLRWASGVILQAEDIESTIAAVTAASPRGRRPLLVHIGRVERITPEAKQLLVEDTCSTRTAVVGVDEVSRVLTAFNYRSATPSRYFTEEADAIAWLREDPGPDGAMAPGEAFRAEMRGDVLWVECETSTDVTNDVAEALVTRVHELSPSVCPPMLIRLNHLVSLTEDALHSLATGLDIASLAIVGAEPGDPIITAYYKQQHHPPYPTRHFTTAGPAQAWLADCFRQGPG